MIPENVRHWHGAAKDSVFSHLAIGTNPQAGQVRWLLPVDKGEFDELR